MNSKEEHCLVVDLVIIRQRQHMSGAAECEDKDQLVQTRKLSG